LSLATRPVLRTRSGHPSPDLPRSKRMHSLAWRLAVTGVAPAAARYNIPERLRSEPRYL
jgi:hypothetical protein